MCIMSLVIYDIYDIPSENRDLFLLMLGYAMADPS